VVADSAYTEHFIFHLIFDLISIKKMKVKIK